MKIPSGNMGKGATTKQRTTYTKRFHTNTYNHLQTLTTMSAVKTATTTPAPAPAVVVKTAVAVKTPVPAAVPASVPVVVVKRTMGKHERAFRAENDDFLAMAEAKPESGIAKTIFSGLAVAVAEDDKERLTKAASALETKACEELWVLWESEWAEAKNTKARLVLYKEKCFAVAKANYKKPSAKTAKQPAAKKMGHARATTTAECCISGTFARKKIAVNGHPYERCSKTCVPGFGRCKGHLRYFQEFGWDRDGNCLVTGKGAYPLIPNHNKKIVGEWSTKQGNILCPRTKEVIMNATTELDDKRSAEQQAAHPVPVFDFKREFSKTDDEWVTATGAFVWDKCHPVGVANAEGQ